MTDPKALADEIKAAVFGSHSDPERGTTQEELLYLADQENYARHRYGEDLIRESMVKEYALRVTALRRMAEGEAMRDATVYPEMERDIAFAAGVEYEKKRTALQSDTPPATPGDDSQPARAGGERERIINECADFLTRKYPDNVNTNAFCAALRSLIRQPFRDDSPPATAMEAGRQWHHKKSGHVVIEIGRGRLQTSADLVDMQAMVIYEHDGNLWCRAQSEFEDGRFELVVPKSDGGRAGQSPLAAALCTTLPDSEPAGSRRGGPSAQAALKSPIAYFHTIADTDGEGYSEFTANEKCPWNLGDFIFKAETWKVTPLYAQPAPPVTEPPNER